VLLALSETPKCVELAFVDGVETISEKTAEIIPEAAVCPIVTLSLISAV
jgi:hypothetical protein